MNIGYVRVSTAEQNEARQLEALERFKIEKWFTEKVSGKNTDRKEFKDMLEFAREGDTIYIHDFSRLARSTKDLLETIEYLQSKKINLVSNKENIDMLTPQGKLMITMLGAINEFERENILDRQREGIDIAKRIGIYKGRREIKFPHNWVSVYEKYQHRRISTQQAMEELNLKKTTFYKLLREYKKPLD